jgi:Gpi18-like mannosyltransferase
MNAYLRNLVLIWLGWFVVLYGFQSVVDMRLDIERPDYAVEWSATETGRFSNKGKIYLLEPFLNKQVAWDSEYYVGIAVGGYDDPEAGRVTNPRNGHTIIKNYSFFPLYPYIMRAFMLPLGLAGMNPIATAALAGVIVALLGTLAGMIALWELTRGLFEEETAYRSVFYMLIFPSAFFFAQVYTEGLFIGLAFWCLVFIRRGQWGWAALLGVLAAWTRAHGAVLAIPLVVAWLRSVDWKQDLRPQISWRFFAQAVCALLPVGAYLAWRGSPLGQGWAELQSFYFGRGLMSLESSINSWTHVLFEYAPTTTQGAVYFALEVIACLLALGASIWLVRRSPEIALYSLGAALLSVLSGSAQSMARYMLIVPALFIFLAYLGRSRSFDRVWTIASVLLLGMSVMLYSFDMWVG